MLWLQIQVDSLGLFFSPMQMRPCTRSIILATADPGAPQFSGEMIHIEQSSDGQGYNICRQVRAASLFTKILVKNPNASPVIGYILVDRSGAKVHGNSY